MHTPNLHDFCRLMKIVKTDNILIKAMGKVIDQVAPGLLHECPYMVSTEDLRTIKLIQTK